MEGGGGGLYIFDLIFCNHCSQYFFITPVFSRKSMVIRSISKSKHIKSSEMSLRGLLMEGGPILEFLRYIYIYTVQWHQQYHLFCLGLQGNPLSPELSKLYHEQNGSAKLLQFLLDHLASKSFLLL